MIQNLLKNKQLIYVLLIALMILLMGVLSSATYDYGFFSYGIGDVARDDIVIDTDVIDVQETALLRKDAMDQVTPIEYIDITIQINVRKTLDYFFETLNETKEFHASDPEILKNVYYGIERNNSYKLNEDELKYLAVVDEDRLSVFKNTVMDTSSEFLSSGISEAVYIQKTNQVVAFIESFDDFNDVEKAMAIKIINQSLVVNQFEDVEKTNSAKQNAYDAVEDVLVSKGTVLVTSGSQVTGDTIRLMEQGGMLVKNKSLYTGYVAVVFLFTVFWLVLGKIMVYRFAAQSTNKLFMYQVIFTGLYILNLYLPKDMNGLLMIPLLSILLTLVGNPMVGFINGLVMIIILGLIKPLSPEMIIMYLGGIILVSLLVNRYAQRRQLMMAGTVIAGFNCLFLLGYNFMTGQVFIEFYSSLLIVLVNGFLSAILALGLLPIIEIVFKVLTPIKLMELTNPNQPLLKRLLVEAPGTYHHSIIVGNLAETAAHAINCDYMLARVGAHYHDIGKLQRPYYFKENQLGDENIHDQLEPVISAGIIKSHVSHGEHLAKKFKLPKEIVDIINEHHGTTMIKYFYHKAISNASEDESIGSSKYTYDGPTPRSRESAVVMLADSVEAAVRSLKNHSDESILKMVKAVFKQKMDDGQLNHCDLTMNDLEDIQQAFIKVLSGIFHDRVQYPKEEE